MNPFLAKQFQLDIKAEKAEEQKQGRGKSTGKKQVNTEAVSETVTRLN